MERTIVLFVLIGYSPMLLAVVLYGLRLIEYSTAWGYLAVGAAIWMSTLVVAAEWLWALASFALFILFLRCGAAAQEENLLIAKRRNVMSTFFTRLGAFVFVMSQVMKALTAVFFLLIILDFTQIPNLGWIHGNERSSPILLSALAAMIAAAFAVFGSVARPTGPGTRKWWFNDAFWTLVLIAALVVGLFGPTLSTTITLTGTKLDLAIMVCLLVVIQVVATLIADRIQDMVGPTAGLPAAPAPTFVRFTANPTSVAAGGTVVLDWATANAVRAEIGGFGPVPVIGPLSWTVRAAAGATEVVAMSIYNRDGQSVAQSVSIAINP